MVYENMSSRRCLKSRNGVLAVGFSFAEDSISNKKNKPASRKSAINYGTVRRAQKKNSLSESIFYTSIKSVPF